MPRKYIKKYIRCQFDPENMKKAIAEVKKGVSIRTAAKKFEVPPSTLGKHYKNPEDKIGAGRKQEIPKEEEAALSKYLETCATHGEGLTKSETLNLVKEFLDYSKLKTRWNDNKPSDDWFNLFLKRHPQLRIRKGEQLSNQRVRGADPFTVNRFYKDVKKLYIKEKLAEGNGKFIYNCDETSFAHDPSDVRVIAKKGTKRVSKNVAGSGKLNTTVLACGGADGTKMPPFIIFSGTYVWSTWIPENDYPGTVYTAQKKGWMEGTIFANWFSEAFLKNIPSKEQRNNKKIILFFDGVAFHVNYPLIKMAYDNNVILIKLPPNLTHFMQPLDLTVFKPLKNAWNNLMVQWNRTNPGTPLPREEFSKKIKVLWEEHFHPRLLVSGFLHTGLFPADASKFPEEAYNPIKLQRFKAIEQATASKHGSVTPSSKSTPTSVRPSGTPRTSSPALSPASANPALPKPLTTSETCTEVPATPIEQENQPGCSSWQAGDYVQHSTSFENFIRFKLTESVMKSTPKLAGKRKKISGKKGEILTSKKVMERVKKAEDEKTHKKVKTTGKRSEKQSKYDKLSGTSKITKGKKPQPKKRKVSVSSDSESSQSLCMDTDGEEEYSLDQLISSSSDESLPEEIDPTRVEPRLEMYYAVYYDLDWYVGRVIDFPDEGLCKVKFLKKELSSFNWPAHDDIQTVPSRFVFYGPIKLEGNGPFQISRGQLQKIRFVYSKAKKGF